MRLNTYENWARVTFHLNGGFVRVEITDESGVRLNMPTFDVPTHRIPFHLRRIGSRFLLRWTSIWPEDHDIVCEYRDAIEDSFKVIGEA